MVDWNDAAVVIRSSCPFLSCVRCRRCRERSGDLAFQLAARDAVGGAQRRAEMPDLQVPHVLQNVRDRKLLARLEHLSQVLRRDDHARQPAGQDALEGGIALVELDALALAMLDKVSLCLGLVARDPPGIPLPLAPVDGRDRSPADCLALGVGVQEGIRRAVIELAWSAACH
jgi:hypothetical protein